MSKTNKKMLPVSGVKHVKVEYVVPPDLPLHYSDNLLVQNREGLFTLLFMQNRYPIILTAEDARRVNSAESVCVAKILVNAFQFAKTIRAMEDNFEKFLKASSHPAKNWREFLEITENEQVTFEEAMEANDANVNEDL